MDRKIKVEGYNFFTAEGMGGIEEALDNWKNFARGMKVQGLELIRLHNEKVDKIHELKATIADMTAAHTSDKNLLESKIVAFEVAGFWKRLKYAFTGKM